MADFFARTAMILKKTNTELGDITSALTDVLLDTKKHKDLREAEQSAKGAARIVVPPLVMLISTSSSKL